MPSKELVDFGSRKKAPSPLGTTIFVGLRSADVFLQYAMIQRGWGAQIISMLGGRAIAPMLSTTAGAAGGTGGLFGLGLQPYYVMIAAMSLGSMVKQNVQVLFVQEQEMPLTTALILGVVTMVLHSVNTLLSLWVVTSQAPAAATTFTDMLASPTIAGALTLYVVGILTESISEIQRRTFKKDSKNKGKPYGGGLFSLATNINYGGYTLWRSGYAMAAAGPLWAMAIGGMAFYDFTTRGIPVMDKYCTEKVRTLMLLVMGRTFYSTVAEGPLAAHSLIQLLTAQ
ncbi:MAG: hypothetical protein M1827_002713 [Pycnora praestabilis]|nr:MAG: hypothetical protein M1827_002713 [Pycnora praestabilis]